MYLHVLVLAVAHALVLALLHAVAPDLKLKLFSST
jgi:hypothetical protein